jgi:drug/metabolite transporter (DMT)-like permease
LLAVVWLREPVSWQVVTGVALMVAGALLTPRVSELSNL